MSLFSRIESVEALAERRAAGEAAEALAEFREWRMATWAPAELEALERLLIHMPLTAEQQARGVGLAGIGEAARAEILAIVGDVRPEDDAMVRAALARATPEQRARWGVIRTAQL